MRRKAGEGKLMRFGKASPEASFVPFLSSASSSLAATSAGMALAQQESSSSVAPNSSRDEEEEEEEVMHIRIVQVRLPSTVRNTCQPTLFPSLLFSHTTTVSLFPSLSLCLLRPTDENFPGGYSVGNARFYMRSRERERERRRLLFFFSPLPPLLAWGAEMACFFSFIPLTPPSFSIPFLPNGEKKIETLPR